MFKMVQAICTPSQVLQLRLVGHKLLQSCLQIVGHARLGRSPAFTVDEDVDELSNSLHVVLPSFEDAYLIRDRALAQLVDT